MKVCVVGTGYVGLTTGVSLAFLGHEVTCVDLDQAKVDMLAAGRCPIYEPGMEDLLAEAAPNLTFTTSYADAVPGADVVFVAVQTPSAADGSPDLRYLRSAAESVAQALDHDFTVVVNKSTVPIGSGNWVDAILRDSFQQRENGSEGTGRNDTEFAVASNPEFLREGNAIADTLYPDRIVIGSDNPRSLEVLNRLYRPIINQTFTPPTFLPRPEDANAVPLVSTDLASAELIKYAANAFLALKISYANEIGQLAAKVGADITEVARGMGLDQRIGSRFLQPGVGWGGSCFGKDTKALIATAAEYNLEMPIVKAARDVNQRQRAIAVERLQDELRILKGRKIGLLGLAFKPNTDDLRDAPALDIANSLIARGARVKLHDPVATERFRIEQPELAPYLSQTIDEVFADCDAVVLVTEWGQYLELDWSKFIGLMRTPIILDGRHVLDAERMRRIGYKYIAVAG
ncbi:putative UDP-glucose 6-dehydrogenase [Actinoplanes missouriensis 431]|uniref:UDP-glucose 6-dehydrogenase n=1 Tax=Actinoplanes missouriensis (strain ATCC 14538 / DSM 43046 / CBS 188.64 / JCM 3121 / NBRC 102363 / NCIMB 12654 / NRRL B-3342 / UNCC 431) TaxID=512565 RepID=I0HBF8_ACTM4|nr:UDP-glucose/GDP-mannose dehydrogenase family protein [Actinoplanes missouriensis]BAL90345.1 putative UDP-glucose 6-dehydrogenase [Actinoplanes missouriensis 431]